MLMRLIIILFFLTVSAFAYAQDVIYKNDGTKLPGVIITEINPTQIKYKKQDNPSGPNYVISKQLVLLIEYKNGSTEIINKTPEAVSPAKAEEVKPSKKEKEKNQSSESALYLNKNTLMINGAALINADATFIYDRELIDGHLSVSGLAGYNFNNKVTWPNFILQNIDETAKKNYDLGFGFNFYPLTNQKVQYFIGMLFKYMNYSYNKETKVYQIINGIEYESIEIKRTNSYQFSTMVVNGFQVRLSPTFNYKGFIGIGGGNSYGNNSSVGLPKIYIGTCFGYRF